ncbi:MAG: flagellar basal body P-ring protein FlgI [Deltaproteobacteria bacterium]|jgi:flagellar P-ring protein precursor FlgI|nr:flagellar basal body P-ring protein FlgI [Deltaproteobacteria bacterium]
MKQTAIRFFVLQLGLLFAAALLSIFIVQPDAEAARIKDIANVRGVRDNQLLGYGVVVGLKGTGDSKAEFTNKSILRMLDKLGMKVEDKEVASKNVAAVIITASLPAFARAGNKLDVSVNSIGDATSLAGGTLIQSPLRAADQNIYAVAQGALLVGTGADMHPTVGRLPNGAIIERDVAEDFTARKMFRLTLHNPDFTTAARLSKRINMDLSGKYASAKDAGTVDIIVPFSYEGRAVELLATIESLEVTPDTRAKVIVNEKTGTVVIGDTVRISKVAISHGDLAVKVDGSKGKSKDGDRVAVFDSGTSVGDLVKSLNQLGVSPRDLITVLQNIKAAGALQGELEIL